MAKVYHRKAGKDYPDHGIKKGDMYYTADIKTGPRSSRTLRSLTPLHRSQLTTSPFLSTAYGLSDQLDSCSSLDDLNSIKEEFESLLEETQGSLDNMPEGLQQGPTGELLQERIDQIESLMGEIDSAIDEVKNDDEDEDERDAGVTEDERVRAAIENNVSSTF